MQFNGHATEVSTECNPSKPHFTNNFISHCMHGEDTPMGGYYPNGAIRSVEPTELSVDWQYLPLCSGRFPLHASTSMALIDQGSKQSELIRLDAIIFLFFFIIKSLSVCILRI